METQKKTKKILIVATSDSGGAGTTIHRLYSALINLGYNVKFLVNVKSNNDDCIIQVEKKSICQNYFKQIFLKFIKNKWPNYFTNSDYYFFNKFEREHDNRINKIKFDKNFKPDIIIGSWISGFANFNSIGKLASEYNAKVYLLMNDMAHLTGGCHYNWDCDGYLKDCANCPAILDERFKNQAKINLYEKQKSILKYNLKLIAGSKLTKSQAQNSSLFGFQSEINIFNGIIDFNIFNSNNRDIAKQLFGISLSSKVIFCGALDFNEKRKGFKELIDVLRIYSTNLINKNEEITVLVVGTFSNEFDLPNINFKYIDRIKDPLLLSLAYQTSDLFLSTSIEDCGPMMVAESLACGTPVIGFEIGLVSSLIINSKNGYKVKLFDIEEMAVKIDNILRLKKNELSENCTATVREKFSLQNLENLIDKL